MFTPKAELTVLNSIINYSTDRILNPNKHDRAHRYCQLPNLRKKALANQTWLPYRLLSTVFFLLYITLLITRSPSFSSRPSFNHITSSSLSYWFSPFFSFNSFILSFCCQTSDHLTSPSSSSFCPSFHTLTSVSWSNRCPSFRFPFSYYFSSFIPTNHFSFVFFLPIFRTTYQPLFVHTSVYEPALFTLFCSYTSSFPLLVFPISSSLSTVDSCLL